MARNTLLSRLLLLAVLAVLAPLTAAQLSIYTGSDKYKYQGCYNETNDLPNTAHERALSGGASKVMEGNMTVPLCLSFCSTGADKQYNYAGVEYSRCVPPHPPPPLLFLSLLLTSLGGLSSSLCKTRKGLTI